MELLDKIKDVFTKQAEEAGYKPEWLIELQQFTRAIEAQAEKDYFTSLHNEQIENELLHLMRRITSVIQYREDYYKIRLHMVTKAIEVGLWEMNVEAGDPINPDHKVIWSEDFRKMLGYENEIDFPNVMESWSNLLHPEEEETVLEKLTDHLLDHTGLTKFDEEYRLLTKAGEYKWFRATGTTIREADGHPIMVAGALFDINDKKIKEQQLNAMIARYDLINQVLVEAPWDMNINSTDPLNPKNEVWWSDQFRRILGFKDINDFPNLLSSWLQQLHPEDYDHTLEALSDYLSDYSGKTEYAINFRLKSKTGDYRWYHAKGETDRNEQGMPLRIAGTIRDITRDINKEEVIQLIQLRMEHLLEDIKHI